MPVGQNMAKGVTITSANTDFTAVTVCESNNIQNPKLDKYTTHCAVMKIGIFPL